MAGAAIKRGVPPGSAHELFTIYTLPTGDIISEHDTMFHLYAEDASLYLSCPTPNTSNALKLTLSQRESYIDEIGMWMPPNGPNLNDSKIEFLVW